MAEQQEHTGGMIALVPSDESIKNLAVDGGDPPEELHVTLVYLGDDVTELPEEITRTLLDNMQVLAAQPPFDAQVFAHAVFNPDSAEFDPATVYLLNGADLQGVHGDAVSAAEAMGALLPRQHPNFYPHVTAGYGLDPGLLSYTGPVAFDKIRLALAGEVHDFPLGTEPMPNDDEEETMTAAATPAADPKPELEKGAGVPVEFPVLIVEGLPTADGRFIEPGSLSHRALPLPILAQTSNPVGGDGHDGAQVIGRIDTLERVPGPEVVSKETGQPFPEGTFVWRGKGEVDPSEKGAELAQKGYLTGNSADLSEVQVEYSYPEIPSGGIPDEVDPHAYGEPTEVRITNGKIAATTLVPIPAFAEAYVVMGGEQLAPADDLDVSLTAAAPPWRAQELGDDSCLPCAGYDGFAYTAEERRKLAEKGQALPDGSFPVKTAADIDKAIRAVGRARGSDGDSDEKKRNAARRLIIQNAKRLGVQDKIPDTWNADGTLKEGVTAAATMFPPVDYFTDPGLVEPTGIRLIEHDDFIEVVGHLASWGTCHTSFAGQCVQPPRSSSDYAYFNVGAVRALDNAGKLREVGVGHITMASDGDGGHAPANIRLSAAEATAFYDNVNTVVADVAAGEDQHGIWVHGIVRRGVSEERVAALAASPLSGDWRAVDGRLELVAALAVNTPGFPVPRARVASGAPVALVAAGALRPAAKPESQFVNVEAVADEVERRIAARAELAERRRAALADLDIPLEWRALAAEAALDGTLDEVASLAKRKNWVEKAGGLPPYIKRIEKHLREKGMDESRAIATAVNTAKKMCSTGDVNWPGRQQVNAGSQAEACAAVADWERKKAQS